MTKIKYILPDFAQYGRNEILIDICQNHRYMLKENVGIYSFYGTFSNARWNGGRVDLSLNNATKQLMKKVRNFYNKKGIVVTFTFTNPLIKEEHLNDKYCNQILKIFHNGQNEVLVVSPILEEYIRKNYPKYKINKSITFASNESIDIDGKYNLVVINQKFNHDFKVLKNIKQKDKIEILCDSICFDYCKKSQEHYYELGKIQLLESKSTETYGNCKYYKKINPHYMIVNRNKNSKNFISSEEIHNVYAPMGFEYFKLSERDKIGIHPYIALDSILEHLIKPEYQNSVRIYILERMFMETEYGIKYNLKKYGKVSYSPLD